MKPLQEVYQSTDALILFTVETYHTVNLIVLFPRKRERSSAICCALFLLATITIM